MCLVIMCGALTWFGCATVKQMRKLSYVQFVWMLISVLMIFMYVQCQTFACVYATFLKIAWSLGFSPPWLDAVACPHKASLCTANISDFSCHRIQSLVLFLDSLGDKLILPTAKCQTKHVRVHNPTDGQKPTEPYCEMLFP